MHKRQVWTSRAAHWLHWAESGVLLLIGIVLVGLALLLLASSVLSLVSAVQHGSVRDGAIEILDSVLLVMMTMEIVYTVAVSLESHTLVAEPFLIIGMIAAIRRMLVITAESTKLEASNPAAFRNTLIELGLLALMVLSLAGAIMLLRGSEARRTLPPDDAV
jgi:uncharacterized membrane protein (DUF373 family)